MPRDKKTETGFMIPKYFSLSVYIINYYYYHFFYFFYFFFKALNPTRNIVFNIYFLYIHCICIIASNDNNQCMQFACPH